MIKLIIWYLSPYPTPPPHQTPLNTHLKMVLFMDSPPCKPLYIKIGGIRTTTPHPFPDGIWVLGCIVFIGIRL